MQNLPSPAAAARVSRLGNSENTNLLAATTQSAFICFRVFNVPPRPRKRAKFAHERREEVNKVRKRRACLRCRLLKITCSGDEDPCATCMKLALATSTALERKVLRWSDCIRTLLTDVKFFDEIIPPDMTQHPIQTLEAVLAATPVTLVFSSQMKWEIDSFSNGILTWLNSREPASTSKVGAMSSPQFQDLIKPLVGNDISTSFRLMIYAISLAYTQRGSDHEYQLSRADLQKIGAFAGKRCLKFLDNTLMASSLARIFKDGSAKKTLQALFLLAFGIILAIGYAQPVTESPVFPGTEINTDNLDSSQTQTLHRAMQTHLCRTLAHHIVYLGSRIGLPISSTMERFILDAAESMWNKEGRFIWKTTSAEYDADENDEQQEELPSHYNYLQLDVEKWPVYLTEPYYDGGSNSSQASGPFAGNVHREFPVGYLSVVEEIRILEYLNYGAILNAPSLEDNFGFQCATQQPHLPLNVPEPEAGWFLPAQGSLHFPTCCGYIQGTLQGVVPNWLLV